MRFKRPPADPVEDAPATWAFSIRLVMDMRVGVELFFVISGFILAIPFAMQHLGNGNPVSLKSYYWRRVTRLEPPYLLMLFLCFATLVFYWGQSASDLALHMLASAVYMHNVFWRRALPGSRPSRAAQERKPIPRDRCASSSGTLPSLTKARR
jgi:peptidoglycan/LPS O-acetylase OafA/YrhL